MELLGWSLVILAVLLVTGLLGPILGVVLAIAALPALAVLGLMLFPLLLVLGLVLWVVGSAIGVAAGLLGFLLQWGLPLLLFLLGIWLLTRRRRPPLPGGSARPEGNLPR